MSDFCDECGQDHSFKVKVPSVFNLLQQMLDEYAGNRLTHTGVL